MVSIVIPTFNERESLQALWPRLAAVRRHLDEPLEVLVVDDRSTDGTQELAEQALQADGMGRLIRRDGARDLAQSVMEGVRHARGDVIGVMDADLSHPPELLPALLQAVRSGADVAVASRYVPGGGIAQWSSVRRLLSWSANAMARPLVGVRDATSGYFLAHATLWRALLQAPYGFKILLELLACGQPHRVQEIPYLFVDRAHGRSKLRRRVLWRYAAQLGRLYKNRWKVSMPTVVSTK